MIGRMDWTSGYARGVAVVVLAMLAFMGALFAADEAAPLNDAEISAAVENEFRFDPVINLNNVDVMTSEGIVELTGRVRHILASERATNLAATVKGVRAVANRITVQPSERSAVAIEADVQQALLMDRATEAYEIDVHVENSEATLSGVVDSWQEKELALKVAKQVSGLKAVRDNIDVHYDGTARPDNELKPEIEKRLRWDRLVDDALITVEVNDAQVALRGVVGSAAEKSRALFDAWVAGVKAVDVSGLRVEGWARDDALRKDKYIAKSDEEIARAVKDAFLYDPRVFSFNIQVQVNNGEAMLRGQVDHLKAKRSAASIASNTVGVTYVDNRIKVRPNTPTDDQIAERIRQAFRRNPYVDKYQITVSVFNGEVYLSGRVDTYYEKGRAEDLASTIYGVTAVKNRLQVDYEDPLVYNPYVDDFAVYDEEWYDYQPGFTFRDDQFIRRGIEDELFWSPFVENEDVEVLVTDGTATLTGEVDTWTERMSAAEEAYEGGAQWVINRLDVK